MNSNVMQNDKQDLLKRFHGGGGVGVKEEKLLNNAEIAQQLQSMVQVGMKNIHFPSDKDTMIRDLYSCMQNIRDFADRIEKQGSVEQVAGSEAEGEV